MAESKRDYYEVLGIGKDADDGAIKKAYRVLAKKYHPDMNPGDAEAEKKFKEASEAYAVLSDPEKRRQYDQFGHAAFEGGAGGAGGFGGFDFSGADFSDIFGDIFGDLFGGGRRGGRGNGPMRGANIRKSIRITFEEAIFGCEKELELILKDSCTACNGTGAKPGTSPETCSKCGGKGQIVYAGNKRRPAGRFAGRSSGGQTSHLPAPGDAYLLHGSDLFCTGGAWRGYPGGNGRRRSHLYGKTGDQDRYQGAPKGQGSTVPAGFQSKRGSLCDLGDPDSGQTERRGEGSAA